MEGKEFAADMNFCIHTKSEFNKFLYQNGVASIKNTKVVPIKSFPLQKSGFLFPDLSTTKYWKYFDLIFSCENIFKCKTGESKKCDKKWNIQQYKMGR